MGGAATKISAYEVPWRRIEYVRRRKAKSDPRPRITHICGTNQDGSAWEVPLEQAIREVEHGESGFYIDHGGHSWKVGIYVDASGAKHLGTFVAGRGALLKLPEVP